RQRALPFAGAQPGQVLAALFLVAVEEQVGHAQVGMRAIAEADRAGSARDLLHRHQVGEVTHAADAVFRIDGHAQQAELAELGPQVLREGVVVVDLRRTRGDLRLRETLDGLTQRVDLLSKLERSHRPPHSLMVSFEPSVVPDAEASCAGATKDDPTPLPWGETGIACAHWRWGAGNPGAPRLAGLLSEAYLPLRRDGIACAAVACRRAPALKRTGRGPGQG